MFVCVFLCECYSCEKKGKKEKKSATLGQSRAMPVVNGLVSQQSGSCALPPRGLSRLRSPQLSVYRYRNRLVSNVHVGEQGPNSLEERQAILRRRKPVELPQPQGLLLDERSEGVVYVAQDDVVVERSDEAAVLSKTSGRVMREVRHSRGARVNQ